MSGFALQRRKGFGGEKYPIRENNLTIKIDARGFRPFMLGCWRDSSFFCAILAIGLH
jgi:hypothetical protein